MLDDKELSKLCCGRIVYAELMDSDNNAPAGPHYAILIDSDEQIKKSHVYRIVGISTKTHLDAVFIMPVPKRTGLDGFIVGSWTTELHELAIQKVSPHKLLVPEIIKVRELIKAANAARETKKSADPAGPSQ